MYNLFSFKTYSKFFIVRAEQFYALSQYIVQKICSDRTSKYFDGLLHSVFAESLSSSQVNDFGI